MHKQNILAVEAGKAATLIKNGGIVIAPFDTVYGIISDPHNDSSLEKVFNFKNRPNTQILGVAADSLATICKLVELKAWQFDFIKARIPGKYTFILNAGNNHVSKYCQKGGTIAFRVPDSELIRKIAEKSGGIIAQTSANKNGQPNCFSLDDLHSQFLTNELTKIDLIIDGGEIKSTGASEIFDLTKDEIKQIER